MDWFSLYLTCFTLLSHSILHLFFLLRLSGKPWKLWYFFLYFFLLCILDRGCAILALGEIPAITAELAVLYLISRLAMKNPSSISWTGAVLAIYIFQLSSGMVNSLEIILIPTGLRGWLLYLVLFFSTILSPALCFCCYLPVFPCLSFSGEGESPDIRLLLFPSLFFFFSELYLLHTSYQYLSFTWSLGQSMKYLILLLLQALGLGALFCTLYAYRHICQSFKLQASLSSLAQAAQAQKTYVAEAKLRWEKTRAFRHDIQNHLSVLKGLLDQGNLEEAKHYLKRLGHTSSSLSFPRQTGNPVVDILLEEKLGLAESTGIHTSVSLLLPRPCSVDDFDLCVIFANALDNAVTACRGANLSHPPSIRIRGESQGDFYMLEFENTCSGLTLPPAGIGLSNIKAVAEKYHGGMLAEKEESCFRLNLLLNISLPPDNRSEHIH